MEYVWRIMRCCGVTVSLARRFILTCNIATAYVRHKQLRIKAPVRAALLLFFPKQSNQSLEKHYASKEATPREHQGKRENSVASTEPGLQAPSAVIPEIQQQPESETMKRMRTNKRIYVFCLRSSC